MRKNYFSYSVNSTQDNLTPEPSAEIILPKISANRNCKDIKSLSLSPYESLHFTSSNICSQVPQLDYLMYRDRHYSKKHSKSPRIESESPNINFFYQPQILKISPRSKQKVYSYIPINKNVAPVKTLIRKQGEKSIGKYNNQPRILSSVHKKINPPEKDLSPAFTYGEKLWKLNELAALDRKA